MAELAASAALLQGLLRTADREYPVQLRYASKYSLWLRYAGDAPEQATGVFEGLRLNTDVRQVETGRCRVFADADGEPGEYRLIVKSNIHDFGKLLSEDRVDVLDHAARNLPLILGYKDNVDPAFRDHVADISYDLSVYRNLFDRLDGEYAAEPAAVAAVVQQGLMEHLGPEFTACLEAHLARTSELSADFDGEQHAHHGFYLRRQLWSALLSAPFVARTNLKPRGYAGDSEMMQMCYRNAYEGDGSFGKLLHKFGVGSIAGQAVRNRRLLVPALAREVFERLAGPAQQPVRVLSVACGPGMELNQLFIAPADAERFHCALLDQDQLALNEAAAVVKEVEARLGRELSVRRLRESVRTLLATRALRERWGSFHFIYSMGLFDYLTPPVAEAVLKKLYALLEPGGELAIGNFHVNNPTRLFMDYWLDWPLYYRTGEEFASLAAALKGAYSWVEYDDTGVQMLLRVRKTEA
jgi:extracellular factor (EF) 3-hydroxypalmitic acid methyl ester biosynthesis protein